MEERHANKSRGLERDAKAHRQVTALDLAQCELGEARAFGQLAHRPASLAAGKADLRPEVLSRYNCVRGICPGTLHEDSIAL